MKRRLTGKVTSNKMDKTIVVTVERVKTHPIYKKKYKVSRKFKAHAENAKEIAVGTTVTIEETKPMSKEKRWCIVNTAQVTQKKTQNNAEIDGSSA